MNANTSQPVEISFIREYPPSWVDHLTRGVNRLPGPSLVYYLGLAVVLFLMQVLALFMDGILGEPGINTAHIFISAAIPYTIAIINYFNQRARDGLAILRPALRVDEGQVKHLERMLTTLPGWQTLLAGLVGISCIFLIEAISGEPYILESLKNYTFSSNVFRISYMVLWWVFGTLVYHTIHQLRLIGRIYSQLSEINLFRPKNLYAFSNMIALTAFCTALLPIGFLVANPWAEWNDPVVFGTVLAVQIVALTTFIWPHLGIHRLQVAEKEYLIEEANIRFEAIRLILHKKVDEDNLDGAMDVSMTVSSLNTELTTLERIPTWPWQPETLRLLITALALPLGVWLMQILLGRLLAP